MAARIGGVVSFQCRIPSADSIYTRSYADGRVPRTGEPESRYLDFCHRCRAATIGRYDAMFFPPKPLRVAPE